MAQRAERDIVVDRTRSDAMFDLYEKRADRIKPVLWRLLATLVLAASVVSAFGVMTYQPLVAASITAPGAQGTTVTPDASSEPPVYTIAASPGATISYDFLIANQGRWGVTVSGVEPPAHAAFETVTVELVPHEASARDAPFALGPSESAEVRIRATFATCKTPRPVDARNSWASDVVSFRILGLARDQTVDLPYRISIDDRALGAC